MKIIESLLKYNLNYSFINKFFYKSLKKKLPKIKKIVVTFKILKYKTKDIILNLFILQTLTNKKNKLNFLKTKKPNLTLKLRKGIPVGISIIFKRQQLFSVFDIKILKLINFSKLKSIKKSNSLNFGLKKILNLKRIATFYTIFMNNIFNFNINLIFNKKTR